MKTSDQINEIAKALSLAQGEMTGAKKGAKNPFFKSNYSDLSMVIEAISKPFADNGLCFVQGAEMSEQRVSVTTRIIHTSGQWIEAETQLPPTKNDAQGVGSAITYGKRYGLQALAGVPSTDDDGQLAVKHKATPQKVTKASLTKIETKAIDTLLQLSENKDALGLRQAWDELSQPEKDHVWAKLPQDTRSHINELLKAA